ncbi:MAG: hypothetical protein EWM73_03741 [Nitrospira sp.]|nr:MAG: hypothetical protein EWM73_03741 [Nitrospira sp.]
MRGQVAPDGGADEHHQGGCQRQGERKHQVGRREREENTYSICGNGFPGKEQADRASELKKEPGDQPGYEQRHQRADGCAELVESVVGQQHVQDVEMDHRACDCLSRGQERASPRDRVWKKHDDLALEPFGELITIVMLDSVPDG